MRQTNSQQAALPPELEASLRQLLFSSKADSSPPIAREQVERALSSLNLQALTELERALKAADFRSSKVLNAYCRREPRFPSPKQRAFLMLDDMEHVLYGGAAGGGKSSAALACALQYMDTPGYGALIIRRKLTDLTLQDALIPRSHEWIGDRAHWNGQEKLWTFPSGARLQFGYMDGPYDHERYQGAAVQCVVFEEAGQLRPSQMEYVTSRLRKDTNLKVPIRIRYTANPGGEAHEWLVQKFMAPPPKPGHAFIPAWLHENPGLDVEDYQRRLEALGDEVLVRQLRYGDWGAADRSENLIPEFTPEVEAAVVEEFALPGPGEWFTAYVAGDTGNVDLTVFLFGWLDFHGGVLRVSHELVLRDPSTADIREGLARCEAEVYGAARQEGRVDYTFRSVDSDGRLRRDLAQRVEEQAPGMAYTQAQKTDALGYRRRCRTDLKGGRIRIHPRCRTLLATLKHARRNTAGEALRTKETGHADAWDALVYLWRLVQWERNPYPAPNVSPEQVRLNQLAAARRPQAPAASALAQYLGQRRVR